MQILGLPVNEETRSSGRLDQLTTRARAAMLTAACGDALGWPIEPRGQRVGGTKNLQPRFSFIDWTRREGGRYAPFQRHVPAGAYSDDTQLMLAVARSLSRGDAWWDHLTGFELPAWTLYELGGGGAVKRAAQGWAKGLPPWQVKKESDKQRYFIAGANGVAMRILPHAIFGAGDADFDRVGERIVADGLATHGHPRALVGALAGGYAMWTALRWKGKVHYGELIEACLDERMAWSRLPENALPSGWIDEAKRVLESPYEEVWDLTCEEMTGLLVRCQEAIGRGSLARDSNILEDLGAFGKESGAGTRTAAIAIYLASRYIAKPTAGLLAAAFAKRTDADTIACMTGAMLGAFSADDRVDGLAADLQDTGYIHNLAGDVARCDANAAPVDWPPKTKNQILAELAELPPGGKVLLPLFGEGAVIATERPETKSANDITIWWLSTQLGQTLAVTGIKRAVQRRPEAPSRQDGPPSSERRAEQLAMETASASPTDLVRSTWNILFVQSLGEALALYNGILGIAVVQSRERSAVLEGHIVLEESNQLEAPEGRELRAPQLVGVFVGPDSLLALRQRLAKAGFRPSQVDLGRNGDRFRLRDRDGHLVEVFTSLPSR